MSGVFSINVERERHQSASAADEIDGRWLVAEPAADRVDQVVDEIAQRLDRVPAVAWAGAGRTARRPGRAG